MTVRILTGHSRGGGSTIAHINLINALADRGIDGILYGPHDWHLDKCKSGLFKDIQVLDGDQLIVHYLGILNKPLQVTKFIYSCHETNLNPLSLIDLAQFDCIQYVSESQRKWHNVSYPYKIIPNILSDLKPYPKSVYKIAGIIGSIDSHKRTADSIHRAISDGYGTILVYGDISERAYFTQEILPWIERGFVKIMGHCDDKQKMYDSVDVVYHSSIRETFNYVKAECELTGTGYNGLDSSESGADYLSKDEIVDMWIEVLGL